MFTHIRRIFAPQWEKTFSGQMAVRMMAPMERGFSLSRASRSGASSSSPNDGPDGEGIFTIKRFSDTNRVP